jgi:hypothetical protein
MSHIRHAVLQKKLDHLDEFIDTLERDKQTAGDGDLPRDIEEAKEVLQMARQDYSRGEFQRAWLEAERAEFCVFMGRSELSQWKELMAAIGDTLTQK